MSIYAVTSPLQMPVDVCVVEVHTHAHSPVMLRHVNRAREGEREMTSCE